jgi:hypothetical protein
MIIGMFGFYQSWIERYELRISPYRRIQSRQPMPGQLSREEEAEFFAGFWLPEHEELFEQLKRDILSKPVLARPDSTRRFSTSRRIGAATEWPLPFYKQTQATKKLCSPNPLNLLAARASSTFNEKGYDSVR